MASYKKSSSSTKGNTLDVRYSYSGSDVNGWWVVENDTDDGFKAEKIESLSTVSVQVYEPIGRARALGYRGVKGFASSVREIAGTIVVTVIDDNPLKALLDITSSRNQKVKWSQDLYNGFGTGYFSDLKNILDAGGTGGNVEMVNRIAPLIPTFNLFLEYVSEYFDPNTIADYNAVSFKNKNENNSMNLDEQDAYLAAKLKENPESKYIGSQLTNKGNKEVEESSVQKIGVSESEIIIDKQAFKEKQRDKLDKSWNRPKNDYHVNLGSATLPNQNGKNVDGDFNTVGLYIEGIRFISEGVVTSVNDMVTEISYQFIAQDMKPLSKYNRIANQFDGIQNAILRKLSDPDSQTYQFLKELEDRNDLDEQNITVTYDTQTKNYGITIKTDEAYDDIGFTTNAKDKKGGR